MLSPALDSHWVHNFCCLWLEHRPGWQVGTDVSTGGTLGTGLSGELTEMECEFDVPRLMGTSFKQPKGRQLGPPQMWTQGSVGSAPRGQKQGRRVREGAACECSGSSQLRQEGTRGPLNHSGGRARAVKMPSVLPKGAEKNQPIWRKGLRTDGQGHRPSPWSVSCRPWCWEGWVWGARICMNFWN